jgi:hypothetical protein
MIPVYKGRFSKGVELTMMFRPPFINPADPRPASVRPPMSIEELFATPQMREPSSKRKRWKRKTCLSLRYVYTLPLRG